MIEHVAILSLQITGLHIAFQQGNALHFVRKALANLLDRLRKPIIKIWIMKPLTDCLPCMASFWTIALTQAFDWRTMLAVCGLNFIIDNLFFDNA